MLGKAIRRIVSFLEKEDGPTAVEYAVMLAFIIVVCVAAVSTVGANTNSHFANSQLKTALTPAAS